MLIKKWIKAIFSPHVKEIIQGNVYRLFHMRTYLYIKRYRHCRNCEDKTKTLIGEVCGRCGCPLKSKLRVDNEKCELLKW